MNVEQEATVSWHQCRQASVQTRRDARRAFSASCGSRPRCSRISWRRMLAVSSNAAAEPRNTSVRSRISDVETLNIFRILTWCTTDTTRPTELPIFIPPMSAIPTRTSMLRSYVLARYPYSECGRRVYKICLPCSQPKNVAVRRRFVSPVVTISCSSPGNRSIYKG